MLEQTGGASICSLSRHLFARGRFSSLSRHAHRVFGPSSRSPLARCLAGLSNSRLARESPWRVHDSPAREILFGLAQKIYVLVLHKNIYVLVKTSAMSIISLLLAFVYVFVRRRWISDGRFRCRGGRRALGVARYRSCRMLFRVRCAT